MATQTTVDAHDGSTRERAVYVISVAAELAGVHPQTLRIYERKGLVDPARTGGGSRRYSERDIERLRRIQELTDGGPEPRGGAAGPRARGRGASGSQRRARARSAPRRASAVERTHRQYRRDLVPVRQAARRAAARDRHRRRHQIDVDIDVAANRR